ncbi:hypothetical protein [Flavobacterium sp. UGB4466]|uniref:hypothetical protein n=1 Tax=Flavobacterium sp. UGB4466 TaxID=2730889 RepID=UPI00192A8CA9|nr:hypothetical protein [Flavobacterium sp. UGB4466]
MKRILFSIALLSSVYLSAQTVIVEEKYEKNNEPTGFRYLPNSKKFVVFKGEKLYLGAVTPSTIFYMTKSGYSFDENGSKSILFENKKLANCTFSVSENSFKALGGDKLSSTGMREYYLNNVYNSSISFDDIKKTNSCYFGLVNVSNQFMPNVGLSFDDVFFENLFYSSFSDFYDLGLTNQKGKNNINFEKDEIYLEVFDLKSKQKNRVKLETPKLDLLKGNSLIESTKKGVTFSCKLKANDTFDMVTKSISKERNENIIYKTTYDIQGKKIKDVTMKLNLKDNFFILSSCGAGYVDNFAWDVQAVNNYYEDSKNGDIYVYGIYNSEKSRIHKGFDAVGFYIFKFDKDGNKIWESINPIKDENFEGLCCGLNFNLNLFEYNGKLLFTNSADVFMEFSNYAVVEKSSGNVLKMNNVIYNRTTSYLRRRAFVNNSYDKVDIKNKAFSPVSFVAMDLSPAMNNYLKTIPSKGNAVYFETIFSDQGIWLIETDNEEYYKVLLFKD